MKEQLCPEPVSYAEGLLMVAMSLGRYIPSGELCFLIFSYDQFTI